VTTTHPTVSIRYWVELHESGRGFSPRVAVNGRDTHAPWTLHGVDPGQAIAEARNWALDTASRYTGDWTVTVLGCDELRRTL
jgi:hypothetical protein